MTPAPVRFVRRSAVLLLTAVALPVLASGCDNGLSPEEAPPDGLLKAQLQGTLAEEYQGDAGFYLGRFTTGEPQLNLRSEGQPHNGRFSAYGAVEGIPEPGTYEIRPHPGRETPEQGFVAAYFWSDLDVADNIGETVGEWYTSLSGRLVIESSSEDHIEGEFFLTAVRYCNVVKTDIGSAPETDSCKPWEVADDAPRIEAFGTFVAVPVELEEVEPMPGDD